MGVTGMNGFAEGAGCQQCNHTGYRGRMAVYEMLEMTPALAQAANQTDPRDFLLAARQAMAGQTLGYNALALARSGKTSLAEAVKVSNQGED
jgi:MSHA biogenesis protein MshE